MDKALPCYAGGPGSIPAVVVARVRGIIQMNFFHPLGYEVIVRNQTRRNLRALAFPEKKL